MMPIPTFPKDCADACQAGASYRVTAVQRQRSDGSTWLRSCINPRLHTHGKRLGRGLVQVGAAAPALKTTLQQRQQAGVPVTDDKEQQEWDGEVVFVGDGVGDSESEVATDEQFTPGHDTQPLAVFGCLRAFALLLHAIFRCPFEGALDAEERLQDSAGVGDGETDAERHEEGKIEKGLEPTTRIELLL